MAKIMVLDDMVDAVELTKRIMEEAGHQVFTFTEEDAALQFVRDNRIDLAILDIRLKKMSGVDVLAQIKQHAPQIKAIMLTGYPTVETAQESTALGACDYCVKPIDNEELVEKVATALKSS
jgi:DNA-binding NtrC family response regulator